VVVIVIVPVVSPALIEPPLTVTIGASVVPPVPVSGITIIVVDELPVASVAPVAASSPEHAARTQTAVSQ